jgi:homoserine kinase
MRITVRVPATSANLGPGFDCFALALDLVNEVTLVTGGGRGVSWEGEGADELPTDGSDVITRAIDETAHRLGLEPPSGRIHGLNRIPLQRGLGSSAAAVVAGIALADAALGAEMEPTDVLEVAAAIEGHPDNAAAAVFGGFTMVVDDRVVARFDPDPALRPVLLVPDDLRISTKEARRVLPAIVPRQDAVANAGHAALTAVALLHQPELLFAAMRDRLHEEVRLGLVPAALELYERVRAAGLPVCVSGSGPTLLAFEVDGVAPEPGSGWRVLRVPVRERGLEIEVDR